MEVKPGYKMTEVGVIPEDWEATKLGRCSTFKTGPFGSALHQSDYVYDGVPVVNPMQILDGTLVPTSHMSVAEQAARRLTDFRICFGDIVIGRRGEMGRCAYVLPQQDGWLCGTGSMIIRVSRSVDARFIQRLLASAPIIAAIENTSVGSTMINLNQSTLANLVIPLPPTKAEQEAIASALSDVDALIESLEQLLAKKRNIKQGAMQELLTGKRRLPGFSGEWQLKRLGDVVDTDPQNLSSSTSPDFCFKYIALEDVEFGNLVGHVDLLFRDAPSRARRLIQKDDILFGTVRPNLCSHLRVSNLCGVWVCSTGFCVIRCRSGVVDPGFVFQHLFSSVFSKQIDMMISGSNYPAISSSDVRSLEFQVPSCEEQVAISNVLRDMDVELSSLEGQLLKTRHLKQAMMQELLTGRIRLV